MSGAKRLNHIREMLKNEQKVYVSKLSELYGVTEETIRRDLDKLVEERVALRTYGGAILNASNQPEAVHFSKRSSTNIEAKKKIAVNVLPLLDSVRTLSVDSSSTSIELLKLIKEKTNLTVFTNSSVALQVLTNGEVDVFLTGGKYNKSTLSMQGSLAKEMIKKYNFEICVISCRGLVLDGGVQDSNEDEAEVKKAMIEQSAEVLLVVDHTKFDKKAFVQLTSLDNINYIVTDKKPSEKWLKYCQENQITLIY